MVFAPSLSPYRAFPEHLDTPALPGCDCTRDSLDEWLCSVTSCLWRGRYFLLTLFSALCGLAVGERICRGWWGW